MAPGAFSPTLMCFAHAFLWTRCFMEMNFRPIIGRSTPVPLGKTHNPKGANTRGRGNLMQLHQIDHRPQTRREKPLEIVFFWDVCKPNYSSSRVPANHGHLVDALISLIHLAVFEGLVRSQQGISMIWMNLRVGNGVVRFKMPQGVLSQTSADVCTACLRNGRSTSFAASPILNS